MLRSRPVARRDELEWCAPLDAEGQAWRRIGQRQVLQHDLRHKLGADGDRFVVNVWGVGYRLVDGPVAEEAAA